MTVFSIERRKKAYLKPDFEVEGSAGVASSVEEAEGDAAIDAAAKKNGNFERIVGHGTREKRVQEAIREAFS